MNARITDEDLSLRASSDILALCPRDQTVASGSDGLITAEERWTLLSPSTSFAEAGVQPGQLVELLRPSAAFGPSGQLFVVQEVGPTGLLLRRKGQPAGVGVPPGPTGGVLGVEFAVRTLSPQIRRAEEELRHRFGIGFPLPGSHRGRLADDPELREAVILTVLVRQYLDMSREYAGAKDQPADWYAAKARAYQRELEERLSNLTIRRKSSEEWSAGTARFGARISR